MLFGYLLATVTVIIWGITFVCTKSLLQDFSALEILFFRFIIAYIGLWIMNPKSEKIAKKDNLLFCFAGLSGVVLYQFSENIAINFTTASNVSVIVSICPLFTAIIAQIFLKEKHITPFFILGFIISIIGVFFVSLNGNIQLKINPKGDLLALFAGICWGFYSLFVSMINKKEYNLICSTRRIFFFAVIFMIPLMIIGNNISNITANSDLINSMNVNLNFSENIQRFKNFLNVGNLLFLGLLASGFCFSAWNKACKLVGTVKISFGIYLIPVVTIIFAFFTLHEKISFMGLLGAILTITGLFISNIKTSSKM
ncbi:MAG: DMT family transporter [Treponema bryantii]|nr:DMT family transporter [Treponema bryantii]MBR6583050.1 DMT family transporter [Treponema sp.]